MLTKQMTLFTLFGFKVRIDLSWIFLAVLVTWSLAQGFFPNFYMGLKADTYWWMGVFGALGLFGSIIFHELFHSLVARKYGMPMKEITLFIFGGVANMEDEPPNAKAEFLMAIAGPLSSFALALGAYGLSRLAILNLRLFPVFAVLSYLSWINVLLAIFNLVPAFPLDGGRVLRAALWQWKKNINRATRIASGIGSGFGIFLIVSGIYFLISGAFIGGLWWALIGMFLWSASRMSYQRLLLSQAFRGEPVRRFMKSDPVTVPRSVTLDDFVDDYVYKHHFKMFPVSENGNSPQCITVRDVKSIPRDEWSDYTVGEVAHSCSSDNSIQAGEDAMHALSKINTSNNSRLMVLDEQKNLVGILALKDLLRFLSLKLDLEKDELESITT